MKPKEKAELLFNQFANVIYDKALTVIQYKICKQCALIAVDEIIQSRKDDSQFNDTLWSGGSDMYTMHPMYLKYWQEVKKEIEKL